MRRALLFAAAAIGAAYARVFHTTPPPTFHANQTCSVLALSGGGAFGAVQAGMLYGLLESQAIPDTYTMITGISAGGLNAAYLSYFSNISDGASALRTVWSNLTTANVYANNILHILSDWSLYTNAPLETTLTASLQTLTPGVGPLTLIGATNVNMKAVDVWRFDDLVTTDRVDVLMATSAIPFVFPPRFINDTYYIDGGVINNELISQALGFLPCSSYTVVFLSAAHDGSAAPQNITGLFSYISSVGRVLLDTFDSQIAQYERVRCAYPRARIYACYPSAASLDSYSLLNFDYGATLWELGRSAYNCSNLMMC